MIREFTGMKYLSPVLFTAEETAVLVKMNLHVLRNWIQQSVIKPVVKGGRGPGNPYKFSAQQLLGLVVVNALLRSKRGCSRAYAQEIIAVWSSMSDEALSEWLSVYSGELSDERTEESFAVWKTASIFVPLRDQDLPSDKQASAEIESGLQVAEREILRRLRERPRDDERSTSKTSKWVRS
jgi:hypothetical protein